MKKIIPLSIMLALFFMLLLSWNNVLSYNSNVTAEYQKHVQAAESYMEKEIYIDAAAEYKAALKLQPDNYEVAMKIVAIYELLGDKTSYLTACNNAINADHTQQEPYVLLADYYLESNNYKSAYEVLSQAQQHIESQEITERIVKIKSRYTLASIKTDNVYPFFYESGSSIGYAVAEEDNKYGLITSANKTSVKCEYEAIGLLSSDVIPVKLDGEYYYINNQGYRKLIPDESAEYLGTFGNNYAPACINGVYGYLDKKMQKFHFEYTYAGGFYNGLAAVQKDGKWAVINSSFKNVTEFEFDEILMDDYGFCSVYGVFFAKKDNLYYLYNSDGERISEGFEDARLFASNEPAAVKMNGKWGFVSKNGDLVVEPIYECADSFSLGYAPFMENGKWGCIDEAGTVLIEPQFDAMKSFAPNGYALVEVNGLIQYLVVNLYK